jgi:hypothetical protein
MGGCTRNLHHHRHGWLLQPPTEYAKVAHARRGGRGRAHPYTQRGKDVDARKLWGIILIIIGVAIYQAASQWAVQLDATQRQQSLSAFAHLMSALSIIPMALGAYRLVTEGKPPAP